MKPENSSNDSGESTVFHCSTRNEKSHCTTEEVEPGKFVRKCVTTKKVVVRRKHWNWFKACEDVKYTTENTEEDVTDQVLGKSSLPSHSQEMQVKTWMSIRSRPMRLGPLVITPIPFSIKLG